MQKLYTTPEAARVTGIPESTIRSWMRRHPEVFQLDIHVAIDEHGQKLWADALKQVSKQKREEARHAKRAYKSLQSLEEADAQVHTAHRGYIKKVADQELTKKRADVSTARHLHTLRPKYARLGFGLDRSEDKAQQRIDELKAKIKEKY